MAIDESASGPLADGQPAERDRLALWPRPRSWIKQFLPRTLFGRTLLIITCLT